MFSLRFFCILDTQNIYDHGHVAFRLLEIFKQGMVIFLIESSSSEECQHNATLVSKKTIKIKKVVNTIYNLIIYLRKNCVEHLKSMLSKIIIIY